MEFKKEIVIGLILLLFLSVSGYWILEKGPEKQRRERIKPLLDAGLTKEKAVRFDRHVAEQGFRWSWEKNEPYKGPEIKLAKMWSKSPITVDFLIHNYYLQGARQYALIWLLKYPSPMPRFRAYSYWENVVEKSVYGDANGDGVSNYESILGGHTGALDTLKPNPATIYALEKGLSENLVERFEKFDKDSKLASWERRVVDRVAEDRLSNVKLDWILDNFNANPATIHAFLEENLSRKWIKRSEPLGEDGLLKDWEKHMIDHIKEIPSVCLEWASKNRALRKNEKYLAFRFDDLPPVFLENILADGSISYEDWMQAKFLTGFSGEDLEDKSAEWICDPDLDNDRFTNEFEDNVSMTSPYLHNERKAVLLYDNEYFESAYQWNQVESVVDFLKGIENVGKNRWSFGKVPRRGFEKVFYSPVQGVSFGRIVENLSSNVDSNDILLFVFVGHGNKDSPLRGLKYERIDRELDGLDGFKIVLVDSCYSGSAVKKMNSENRLVITSSRKDETASGWFYYLFFSAMQEGTSDLDKNGYCSVMESFKRAKRVVENRFGNHPKTSEKKDGMETYLFELYLEGE